MNISKSDFSINEDELENLLKDPDFDDDTNKSKEKPKTNPKQISSSNLKTSKSKPPDKTPQNKKRRRPPMQNKINIDDILEDIPLPPNLTIQTPKLPFSQTLANLSTEIPHIQKTPQIQNYPSNSSIQQTNPIFFQMQQYLNDYIQSSFFSLKCQITDYISQLLEDNSKFQQMTDQFIKDIKTSISQEIQFSLNNQIPASPGPKLPPESNEILSQCVLSIDQFHPIITECYNAIHREQHSTALNNEVNQWTVRSFANISSKSKELSENSKPLSDFSTLVAELDDHRQNELNSNQRTRNKLIKLKERSVSLEIQMQLLDNEIKHFKSMNDKLKSLNEENELSINNGNSLLEQEYKESNEQKLKKEMAILHDFVKEEGTKLSQFLSSAKRYYDTECKHFIDASNSCCDVVYSMTDHFSHISFDLLQQPQFQYTHQYQYQQPSYVYHRSKPKIIVIDDDESTVTDQNDFDDLYSDSSDFLIDDERNYAPTKATENYKPRENSDTRRRRRTQKVESVKSIEDTPIRNSSLLVDFPALQHEREKELKDANDFLHQKIKAELYQIRSNFRPTRK